MYRLGDLREGRCTYGFFYNQVTCCSGLDGECHARLAALLPTELSLSAGEICTEWQTWSQYFHISAILGQSLLQSFIYIALAVRRDSVHC